MALRSGNLYGPNILIGKVDPISYRRKVPRGDANALEQVLPTLKRRHKLDFRVEKFLGVTTLQAGQSSGPMYADQFALIRVLGGNGVVIWGKGTRDNEVIEYGDWILVPPNTSCSLLGDESFDQTDHPLVVTAARLTLKKGSKAVKPGENDRPRLK